MYGGYAVFHGGLIWFAIWTAATSFSRNFAILVVCRAMNGLGAAAFLPAGLALLGRNYRPGPRKNLVFSMYGALAPIGFWGGILIGGLSQEMLTWRWYFYIAGLITVTSFAVSLFTAPRDYAEARRSGNKMDWWGVCTMVPGFALVVYAITDSRRAAQGWSTPYITAMLVLGLVFLAAAVYVEGWVAEAPLVPADIFKVKYMKRMLLCLFLTWGCFNLFLFYSNF